MTERALSGRRIVVLGGMGGLGRAVVERFRADGASVLVADARLPADADRRQGLDYVAVDALDEASVSAALAATPAPAAVVNLIGGYTPPQALSGLDVAVLRQQLELNLVTAAIVTKYAMPVLAAAGGGPLVHVSSRVATQTGENGFAYSVSKLGVVRLVEAAAAEGREQGVRVNCIMPSIIDTPANRAAMPNAKHDRWPKPAELAAVLAFLVCDDAALISGAAIPVYGRALSPAKRRGRQPVASVKRRWLTGSPSRQTLAHLVQRRDAGGQVQHRVRAADGRAHGAGVEQVEFGPARGTHLVPFGLGQRPERLAEYAGSPGYEHVHDGCFPQLGFSSWGLAGCGGAARGGRARRRRDSARVRPVDADGHRTGRVGVHGYHRPTAAPIRPGQRLRAGSRHVGGPDPGLDGRERGRAAGVPGVDRTAMAQTADGVVADAGQVAAGHYQQHAGDGGNYPARGPSRPPVRIIQGTGRSECSHVVSPVSARSSSPALRATRRAGVTSKCRSGGIF
jgi:NAD(P)-dependent dehydrogenase (short-subunit alcohol dehydrogenase family)